MLKQSNAFFGPLPDNAEGFAPFGDWIGMFPGSKGLSPISHTNGDKRDGELESRLAKVHQFFLQLVLETFKEDSNGGGCFFFTRVDEATFLRRKTNPFTPLPGPHPIDLFVVFTHSQVQYFTAKFNEFTLNREVATADGQPKKKRQKTRSAPSHDLSWRYVAGFLSYLSMVQPLLFSRFPNAESTPIRSDLSAAVVVEDQDLSLFRHDPVEAEDESDDRYSFAARANPLFLFEGTRSLQSLRDEDGSDFSWTDDNFFSAENGRLTLRPSDQIRNAALVRSFQPHQLLSYFTVGGSVDADHILGSIPWFVEPPTLLFHEAMVEWDRASSGRPPVTAEELGIPDSEPLFNFWPRLRCSGQTFLPAHEEFVSKFFTNASVKRPGDPSRIFSIYESPRTAGAALGEAELAIVYPRLASLKATNTQALDDLRKLNQPSKVFDLFQHIACQSIRIAKRKQATGLSPNFYPLLLSLDAFAEKFSAYDREEDKRRVICGIYPHKKGADGSLCFEHVFADGSKHTFSPAAWSEIFLATNLVSHVGAQPTQVPIAMLLHLSYYRIMYSSMSKIVLVFYGDPGTGKSWMVGVMSNLVNSNLLRNTGSSSAQGKTYSDQNSDGVCDTYDEHGLFPTEGSKTRGFISDADIARWKSDMESACFIHETTMEVIDPSTGLSTRVGVKIVKITRGVMVFLANGQCINKAIDNRSVPFHVDDGQQGSRYVGKTDSVPAKQFFSLMEFNHTVSSVVCTILGHFIGGLEIDSTAVTIFCSLLQAFNSEAFGIPRPTGRGQTNFLKLAEGACIDEIGRAVFGIREGDNPATVVAKFTEKRLAELAVRASAMLVVSCQNCVSSFFSMTPLSLLETQRLVESMIFDGQNIIYQQVNTDAHGTETVTHCIGGSGSHEAPWDMGTCSRLNNNDLLVTNWDNIAQLKRELKGKLNAATGAKKVCGTALDKVISILSSREGGGRNTAVLEEMQFEYRVAQKQGQGGGAPPQRKKVCLNLAAFSDGTSPVEAIIVSGLLRILDVCAIEELIFDIPDKERELTEKASPSIIIPIIRKDTAKIYNAAHVVFAHESKVKATASGYVENIADGVLDSIVRPVSDRIARLAEALDFGPFATKKRPKLEPVGKLVGTKEGGGQEIEFNSKDQVRVTSSTKISAATICSACAAATVRSPTWSPHSNTTGVFKIFSLPADLPTYTLDLSKGVGEPVEMGGSKFYKRKAVLREDIHYVMIHPHRCAEIIRGVLNPDPIAGGMQKIIQSFDSVFTGTASWRERKRPDVFSGYRPKGNAKTISLAGSVVPYRKIPKVTVLNHRFQSASVGPQLHFTVEEQKIHSPTDSVLFPQTQERVTFRFGQNIHNILVENRLTQLFGPTWRTEPRIRALKTDWIREFSEEDSPAAGPAAGPLPSDLMVD